MLVDTSFLVDVLRGRPEAIDTLQRAEERGTVIRLPSVALFELYRGLAAADPASDKVQRVEDLVGRLPLLPLDGTSARRGGHVDGALRRAGQMIDPEDAMIAGIALAYGEEVLTSDVDHFGRVEGLNLHTWR